MGNSVAHSHQNSGVSDSGLAEGSDQPSAFRSEDVWAIWLGWLVLAVALAATLWSRPDGVQALAGRYEELTHQQNALKASGTNREQLTDLQTQREELRKQLAYNPLHLYLTQLRSWSDNPLDAFVGSDGTALWIGLAGVFVVGLLLFSLGLAGMGERLRSFPYAFLAVFLLWLLSFVLADQ